MRNKIHMRNKRKIGSKGSITVYMCIIISCVFLLTGVLAEFARIRMAEAIAKEALENSSQSVIAG